ncbi:MAG: GTP-binding protein, partial [Thermoproteota archaeon]
MAVKPHLNMIVTGHIDNGKSTTMGHFLMDLGVVDERTIAAHGVESEKTGKGDTFKYAWVMDNIKDERERGITIDLAFQKFESAKYFFTLIDAPGHRDFIKNMITGASEADAAILVLSAKEGETDTAIAAGGQAREHAFLLKTLGVGQLIVAINKMDAVDYKEAAFKAAKEKAEKLVKSVGYKLENVPIIPVSGWKGDNLVKKSENMPWYTGKTLLLAFDDFTVPEKPIGKPLRVPIQDVYTITGVGTVPV